MEDFNLVIISVSLVALIIVLILVFYYFWPQRSRDIKAQMQLLGDQRVPSESSLPDWKNFQDKTLVRCGESGKIYRIDNGKLKPFDRDISGLRPVPAVDCKSEQLV